MEKQPFLFEDPDQPQVEQVPVEEKKGDVELIKNMSDEWNVYIREKVFGGIFHFRHDQTTGSVVFVSNEGTNFEYPRAERLKEKAQWLAEKALLSKGMYEKRKQKDLL